MCIVVNFVFIGISAKDAIFTHIERAAVAAAERQGIGILSKQVVTNEKNIQILANVINSINSRVAPAPVKPAKPSKNPKKVEAKKK